MQTDEVGLWEQPVPAVTSLRSQNMYFRAINCTGDGSTALAVANRKTESCSVTVHESRDSKLAGNRGQSLQVAGAQFKLAGELHFHGGTKERGN
jgi:hypothetical protein